MKHKGFTVVELIVVVVVIIILATITIVSYSFMREDAMDAKIRTAVQTVGEAIVLYESQNGGSRPTTGYMNVYNGVDTTLVPDYIKRGYRDGLMSKNASSTDYVLKWYGCHDALIVYASLNDPTSDDTSNFDYSRGTTCGHTSTHAPTTGPIQYNYAQVF